MTIIKKIQDYKIVPKQTMIDTHKDICNKLVISLKTLKWIDVPKGFKPTFGLNTRLELIDPNMKYRIINVPKENETNDFEFLIEPWNKKDLFKHIDEQRIIGDSISKNSIYKPYIVMYEKVNKNTAIIGILEHNIYRRYKINNIKNMIIDDSLFDKKDLSKYVEILYDTPIDNRWVRDYLKHGKCTLDQIKYKIVII